MIEFMYDDEKYSISDDFEVSGTKKDLLQSFVDSIVTNWQPSDGDPVLGVVDALEKIDIKVLSYTDSYEEGAIY